jgi:tetratricopeptide (TPR) repeat protein
MAEGIDSRDSSNVGVTGSVSSPANGVVGTVIAPRRRRPWRKYAIMAGVVLLLVAVGVLIWMLASREKEQTRKAAVDKQEAVVTEARQYQDLRQYDKAAASLEEQRKALDPVKNRKEYAETTLTLAKSLVGDKRYDEAIQLYQELETDKEYELDAKRGIGQAYLAKGDKEQARKYFAAVVAIARTKQDPETQFRLTMDEAQLNALAQ